VLAELGDAVEGARVVAHGRRDDALRQASDLVREMEGEGACRRSACGGRRS
jgi:hypothetical protein